MKKVWMLFTLCIGIGLLAGCQRTPEKSSVVSKADGLDENVIADPLEKGQTRAVEMPEHWNAEDTSSDGKMTISADLELGHLEVGNLPVLEMKNHTMTQEELEKLVHYFAGDQELFLPRADTKADFQSVLERMEKGEGAYGKQGDLYNAEVKGRVGKALELAPESPEEEQKAEILFQKKKEDTARNAARGRDNLTEAENKEVYFAAETGKERSSRIEAETCDPDLGNDSSFSWKTGEIVSDESDVQFFLRLNEFAAEDGDAEYTESFRTLAEKFQAVLKKETISAEEGERQAGQVMKELGLPEMGVSSYEKILWFPGGAIPEMGSAGSSEDFLWQADLDRADVGYRYTFTRKTGGLFMIDGGIALRTAGEAYAPPFPVETVRVTVTEQGIQEFAWKGMSEESAAAAENTELLPFEQIQEQLFKQITYWYSGKAVPAESNVKFSYPVLSAQLGYTYIPAYEKPDCAWMVPAWSFVVMEQTNGKDIQKLIWTINALDGGVVGNMLY